MALFAVAAGRAWALPTAGLNVVVHKNKGQSESVIYRFPQDRSWGKLYKVAVTNNEVSFWQEALRQARGVICLPKEMKLRLELSYYGAKDAALLPQVLGPAIVSIDARHLDGLNDEAVGEIAKLPGLLQLLLADTDIGDKSLEAISHMKSLTDLQIQEVNVSAGAVALLGRISTLSRLCLSVSNVGDTAVPALAALKNLKHLQMTRTGISDNALKTFARLSKLEKLEVSQNRKVTDAGMAYLVPLQNLQYLQLEDTSVTVGCLPYLKKLKSLQMLVLTYCKISPDELLKIKQELPGCQVVMVNKPHVDPSLFSPLH